MALAFSLVLAAVMPSVNAVPVRSDFADADSLVGAVPEELPNGNIKGPLSPNDLAHFRERGWVLYREKDAKRSEEAHVWRERILYEYMKRAKELNPDWQPIHPDPHAEQTWSNALSLVKLMKSLGSYVFTKFERAWTFGTSSRSTRSSFRDQVLRPVFHGPKRWGGMIRSNGRAKFEEELVKKTVILWSFMKDAKVSSDISQFICEVPANVDIEATVEALAERMMSAGRDVIGKRQSLWEEKGVEFADYMQVMRELHAIEKECSGSDTTFSEFLSIESTKSRAVTRIFFTMEWIDTFWFMGWARGVNPEYLSRTPYKSFERGYMTAGPLPEALDQLHKLYMCTSEMAEREDTGATARRWRWDNPQRPELGWAHVRYPRGRGFLGRNASIPMVGWHVDRGDYNSMIVFPLMADLKPGGGATAVVEKSHRSNLELFKSRRKCPKEWELFARAHFNANLFCKAGDKKFTSHRNDVIPAGSVVFMHPLLQHTATANSLETNAANWRVGFNLRTVWSDV